MDRLLLARSAAGTACWLALAASPALPQSLGPPRAEPLPIWLPDDGLPAQVAALRRLAARGTVEAAEELAAALAAPEPLLADTAQRAWSVVVDGPSARVLLGRLGLQHTDPRVRVRAAEAVGRVRAELDAEELRALLPRAGTGECLALLRSIEQLGRRRLLAGDVEEAAQWIQTWIRRKHGPDLRAAALAAVAAASPARGARYAEALALKKSAPAPVAAATLATLMALEVPGWSRELERAARSEDPRVRGAAIRCMGDSGSREAAVGLVDLLEREPRAGLAWRASEALTFLTSESRGVDATAWRPLVQALPLDWTAARNRRAVPWGTPVRLTPEGLARLDPRSDRFALVAHLAPPTYEEVAPPPSRRERVIAARARTTARRTVEVEELLGALRASLSLAPAATQAHVLATGAEAAPSAAAGAPLTPALIEAVLARCEASAGAERGDLHAALAAALDLPDVDRVLLVTRGGPLAGEHVDLELVVDLALQQDRFRHVAVDVILVDGPDAAAGPCQRLAAETRGRFVRVEPAPR